MEEARRNVAVGVFVFLGLVALATLILLFGQVPTALMAPGTYPLNIEFDEVVDIRTGNMVTARGIQIGRVLDVGLIDPARFDAGVRVVVAIDEEYEIPEGSRARTTEPMLGKGRPPIEIITGPAGAPRLAAGATMRGSIQKAIDSLLPQNVVNTFEVAARQIGDAAEALTPVLRELEGLLEPRSPADVDSTEALQGNLATVVARFDSALRHFNEVLGDPAVKSQLRATIGNFEQMSEQGKRLLADLETTASSGREMIEDTRKLIGNVDATVTRLDARTESLARDMTDTLDAADRVLDHLAVIGQQVRSGEGNVGRLIMDDKLYESLLISVQRLNQAIGEFEALVKDWRETGKIRIAL